MNNFVSDPLAHYNNHAGDVIIPALSNYYNVNVVVLQANETKCWTDYTGYKTMNWMDTLYFGKSVSDHGLCVSYRDTLHSSTSASIVRMANEFFKTTINDRQQRVNLAVLQNSQREISLND